MLSGDAIILYLLGGSAAFVAGTITRVAAERPTLPTILITVLFWCIVLLIIRAGMRS